MASHAMIPANHAPALSIIIATTQPWPEVRLCLDSLYEQALAVGAEIIVADGHGQGRPDHPTGLFPDVIWLQSPGASVFRLRALAMSHARGQVVAMTEDHCCVGRDWCRTIIEAHEEYPQAAVIGGAVENKANTLIDWASFFYANGAAMPPLGTKECKNITQLNLSYKRRVIPATVPQTGRMEWMFNSELRAKGEKLFVDDRVIVDHIQSLGFRGTCLLHYHGSRAVAGFRLPHLNRLERGIRLLACCVMPPALFLRTLITVLGKKRLLGKIIASVPFLALLVCIRAVGACVGLLAGPGTSPQRIR